MIDALVAPTSVRHVRRDSPGPRRANETRCWSEAVALGRRGARQQVPVNCSVHPGSRIAPQRQGAASMLCGKGRLGGKGSLRGERQPWRLAERWYKATEIGE